MFDLGALAREREARDRKRARTANEPADGAIRQLIELGFERAACEVALDASGGSVDAAAALLLDGAVPARTSPKADRASTWRSRPSQHAPPASGLPFGSFDGTELFLNRVADEGLDQSPLMSGRLEITDLIPPACECALATTFCLEPPWVASKFSSIPNALIVASDTRHGAGKPRLLGDAEVVDAARLEAPSRPGWLWMLVKPAGGIVHAKLLLFRTAGGLRVGITGCNLMGSAQWESMRDAIWVQDFDVARGAGARARAPASAARASPGDFGGRLRTFVDRLTGTQPTEPRHHDVHRLVERLFDGIDFAWAAASLVESMPVSGRPPPGGKPPTGWRRLALAARERLGALADEGSVTAVRDGCRGDPSAAARGVEAPTVWFQAGSFGDLKPPFVRLLEQSVLGEMGGEGGEEDTRDKEEAQWSDILRTRCLWPSRAMALSMRFASLSNLRFMPMSKYEEIPAEVRDRLFFDAQPATFRGASSTACVPISHAKVTLVTSGAVASGARADSAARRPRGMLYLGSHNLSAAAWGDSKGGSKGGSQPSNVELGVLLATCDEAKVDAWRDRLPSQLPSAAELSQTCAQRRYVPAQQPTWLREKMEKAQADPTGQQMGACIEEFRRFLRTNETTQASAAATSGGSGGSGGSRASGPAAPETIELSSDDSDN